MNEVRMGKEFRIKAIGRTWDGKKDEEAAKTPIEQWPEKYMRVDVYYYFEGDREHGHAVFKWVGDEFKQVYARTRLGTQEWDLERGKTVFRRENVLGQREEEDNPDPTF